MKLILFKEFLNVVNEEKFTIFGPYIGNFLSDSFNIIAKERNVKQKRSKDPFVSNVAATFVKPALMNTSHS